MALFRSGVVALVLLGSGYHAASALVHERFAEARARALSPPRSWTWRSLESRETQRAAVMAA